MSITIPPSLPEEQHPPHASADLERTIVRKVSRRLLGFLFILFLFSFLDRINIGFAGLTMGKDLGLSATEFGLATTVFYIAYVLFGIPSNIMLGKVGARRWMAAIMVAWGIASSATMLAQDAASLYWLRILVGITEAGFLPGMLVYLTYWFPAQYRARANALFMIAMPVTSTLGAAVSGYLLNMDGIYGLAGWQWMFLLEGLPSIFLGVAVWFYLDDTPRQARWLTAKEQQHLLGMLEREHQQTLAQQGIAAAPRSLLAEMFSPLVLKFSLAYFLLVNTLAMVNTWVPQILQSFNTTSSYASLGWLTTIPHLCTIVMMILWGARSDRRQERKWHIVLPMLFAALGWSLAGIMTDPWLKLMGLCMASAGAFTAMAIFWTVPDGILSLAGRAIGIAVINATGNSGSAVNAVLVGYLRDLTGSFSSGLYYASAVLVLGALVILSIPFNERRAGQPAVVTSSA